MKREENLKLNNKNMIDKLTAFFLAEKALLNKSDSYMKKIYKNRVETNLTGDRELIVFLVDKMWEKFFAKKLNKEFVTKLTYWFFLLAGRKEITEAVLNHIEYRKSNLK